MVTVNCKKNSVDFSLYKEVFEKHELDGWDGMFEQLYDQFSEFCSYTPAQRYLRLLDRYRRITEIASYGDIASYLNILRRQLQ